MNLVEIVWRWGDLRLYSAMMDTPFKKVLFATLVEGLPTGCMLGNVIELGEELSKVETVIDRLERENG